MTELPHSLTRSLVICAPRDVVFRYFTDSERFASWWGKGSTIDGKVGGEVRIVYPNQIVVRGEVKAIEPDRSIKFTYGYESSQPDLPIGSTLVTIELHDDPAGTRLELRHDLPNEKQRDQHAPGWRFQLSQFANVVANAQHAEVALTIDQWFEAWAETDGDRRIELLRACTADDVRMQDGYACIVGRGDLHEHIGMCHQFMPGVTSRREGDPRHCQGTAITDWVATDATGSSKGKGVNVVCLASDGRIASVVGFW